MGLNGLGLDGIGLQEEQGGGGAPAWSPADLPLGDQIARFRFDSLVSTTAGLIDSVGDLYGNGHTATAAGAERPTLNSAGPFPVAVFGGAHRLSIAALAEAASDFVVWAVLDPASNPSFATVLSSAGGGSNFSLYSSLNTGDVGAWWGPIVSGFAATLPLQTLEFENVASGPTMTFRRNGGTPTAAGGGSAAIKLSGQTSIGSWFAGGTEFANASFGELLLLRQLSPANRALLNTYAQAHFGTP